MSPSPTAGPPTRPADDDSLVQPLATTAIAAAKVATTTRRARAV